MFNPFFHILITTVVFTPNHILSVLFCVIPSSIKALPHQGAYSSTEMVSLPGLKEESEKHTIAEENSDQIYEFMDAISDGDIDRVQKILDKPPAIPRAIINCAIKMCAIKMLSEKSHSGLLNILTKHTAGNVSAVNEIKNPESQDLYIGGGFIEVYANGCTPIRFEQQIELQEKKDP